MDAAAADHVALEVLEEHSPIFTIPQSPDLSASSRPRSSTLASAQFSASSSTPLHRRMSTVLRRVSKDFERSKDKDATRSSGTNKYVPPPPLEPLDPALAASRIAWNHHPRDSEERYYESSSVRGSGYARYPTTKPTTLRVEEHKVKGFRAVWRDFILNLRMKLYRLRKQIFGRNP